MNTQKRNQEISGKKINGNRNGGLLLTGLIIGLLLTSLVVRMDPLANLESQNITVYKSPTCGCCEKWIDHLREAGFQVTAVNEDDMGDVKSLLGVRPNFQSCHTALIGGYVVEGHVPAGDIKRLLQERPDVTGITVPGMPLDSPGMEMPGHQGIGYEVLAFDKNGLTGVFARH